MFLMFISPPLSQTAGLHPTAEQIEMFAYHLPDATLSNLVVSMAIYSLIILPLLSTKEDWSHETETVKGAVECLYY